MAASRKPTYRVAIVNPVAEQHVVVDLHGHEFREREGLEGPFRYHSGRVLYYDTREGRYYDPLRDMYLDFDEQTLVVNPSREAINNPVTRAVKSRLLR